MSVAAARARVEGTVQGVGFRPYVHRLAGELGLAGWVLNDERGVLCEVEGAPEAVRAFLARLPEEAPPLARVTAVRTETLEPIGTQSFEIRTSARRPGHAPPVTTDAATCGDCLAELFDPADRRFRYPFVNCTNCGPRFTNVTGVPYDRSRTTMAGFENVRALPGGVRRSRRPALPRPAQRLPRVRAAGVGRGGRGGGRIGRERTAGGGGDRRGQGDRRLPPGLPGRRRGRGAPAALPQAPRGPAVRAAGPRRGGRALARGARRGR